MLIVASVTAVSGCRSQRTSYLDPELALPITVPLQLDGVHASVEVAINGRPARMLLDTGADQNVFTAAAAQRLGLQPQPVSTPGSGAAGAITASPTWIAELAIGDFRQREQIAYVVAFPPEFAYDGVLGTPFFAALPATIDYQNKLLTLQPAASFEPPPGAASIPVRLEFGKLLVRATAAGIEGWFCIDTGAGNALTFFRPAVERYRLREVFSPAIRTVTGVSPGGYTHGTLVRMPHLAIASHVFSEVVAELSLATEGYFANDRYVGNLGGELWRRFTVTFDYRGGHLYLVPNDAFDQPFIGPRSGLAPALIGGAVKVVDVVAGSPAADSGVQIGDGVLAVNGVPVNSVQGIATRISLDIVSAALRAPPGTQVALRLLDASGAEREVVLLLRELL